MILMGIAESITLGITQGLTEFIPVSSSGHLVILQNILSGASNHLFLEYINIGTVLALIIYFWGKIVSILKDIFIAHNLTLARNIVITSVPAGLAGLLLAGFIDKSAFFGSLVTVAVTLALVGIVMITIEKLPKASPVKDGASLSPLRALVIGLAQMFALIPGVSRSGSTIIAGRLGGLSPAAAAEYSFLASVPIMLGVTAKVLVSSSDRVYLSNNLVPLLVGNLAAFVAGWAAIGFLMRYLAKHSLAVFGWYRLGLALFALSAAFLIK